MPTENKSTAKTIDEYISSRPEEIRPMLRQMRQLIREAAPDAGEKISWGMATFTLYGNLVHFAAETRHMGFHPGPSAIEAFKSEFGDYKYSKGTVQFPYGKALPADLIQRMVQFRVREQTALETARREKKKEKKKITVKK